MKKIALLLTASLIFITPVLSHASDDRGAIQSAVQKYFDGTSQGKPDLVSEVFLPSLEVQWLGDKGELRRRPGPEYIANIKQGKLVPRVGRIVSIDLTDNAASVKAEISWNNRIYTDYMLLLKIGGEWKISNKIATWRDK